MRSQIRNEKRMFTIGIFSTHIPYIAFLLFYAYFFVAGINKAVAGEIPSDENFHKTEIYASESYVDLDIDTYHFFCNFSENAKSACFEDFLFKRKINYPEYSYIGFRSEFYSDSNFCRPPPVA